ncbi:MAG: serine acetyltransferase [Paracoccaceae bacterium]
MPARAPKSSPADPLVSASVPDWSRERLAHLPLRGRGMLRAIRGYQAALGPFGKAFWKALHWLWSLMAQCDVPLNLTVGGGLLLPHPNGIIIHRDAVIGPNCLIFQQVTIGTNGKGVAVIGGHVDIGAGARIIGPVRIGDHAKIGANAVVTRDVPAGAVAVGVPARVLEADER